MKTNRILFYSVISGVFLSAQAFADATSGTCGDNCTWEVDGTTLKFSGTGAMTDYDRSGNTTTAPWASYAGTVTKVEIGSGLTTIGDKAFRGFSSLTTVDFGNNSSVQSIGDRAFSTTGLTSVTIPSSVTQLKEGALGWNSNLSQVNFEDNSQLTAIGRSAFYQNTSLQNVNIPSSIRSIGESAFWGNSSLQSVNFGENSQLQSIGDYAFSMSTSLASVDFSNANQLQTIGTSAFYQNALTNVDFGDNSQLQSIGQAAFYQNYALQSVDFGDNSQLQSIGQSAFSGDRSLENVNFGENSQLKTIGDYAFWANVNLGTTADPNTEGSFTIPASLETIGINAFQGANFDTLIFEEGSQLSSLGSGSIMGIIGKIVGLDQVLDLLDATDNTGNFHPDEYRPCDADGSRCRTSHTVANEGAIAYCKDVAACEAYIASSVGLAISQNRQFYQYTYDPDKGYIVGGQYYKSVADLLSGNSYVPAMPKRIYTVQEAVEALGTKNKNTFSIRYR